MSDPPVYRWDETVGCDRPCQILRRRYGAGGGWRSHAHDYAEVLWVVAGAGEQRIGDEVLNMRPGDIVCVRPEDVHSCRVDRGMAMVNCSFPLPPVADLARRLGDAWPWLPGGPPRRGRLAPAALRRLDELVDDLRDDPIDRDALLLEVVRLMHRAPGGGEAKDLPAWLQQAVEAFADPAELPGGTRRLAAIAGRRPEHVSRTVRACQGRTATDLVNAVRLRWAATALRQDDRPVAAVAAACGLPHLTHFYRLFRAAYGTTPQGWRDAAQRIAGR